MILGSILLVEDSTRSEYNNIVEYKKRKRMIMRETYGKEGKRTCNN